MTSIKRQRFPISSAWLFTALFLWLAGCAKSQQNAEPPFNQQIASDGESLDWLQNDSADLQPDTNRRTFGDFVLEEVEGEFSDELYGVHEGKKIPIVTRKDEECLLVEDERDFDGNGHNDVLVCHLTACGGHCCGNVYFFVSNQGNGTFTRTDSKGEDWGQPTIERWQGKWSVLIKSMVQGVGNYVLDETTERFILKEGKMELVETIVAKEIETVSEIRSMAYDSVSEDQPLELQFDLDEDGKMDQINATLWEEWGRLMWSVEFGSGTIMQDGMPAKRLGVLESMTEGYHDLVVDFSTILEWTGKRYEAREE
jgi:hypothetical protein